MSPFTLLSVIAVCFMIGCSEGKPKYPFLHQIRNARAVAGIESDVLCPRGMMFCPSGNTCCQLRNGQYGCCPKPNAVCCSDGMYCCPEGSTCDDVTGYCIE